MKRSLISLSALGLITLALLPGCSVLEEDKINYKSASKAPSLDIPPDLTQLRRDSRYAVESTSATASGFASAGQAVKDVGTAANQMADVRFERSGNQRWLVVNRPAEKIWDTLRDFWVSNGFVLSTDAPELGILETDWAENRAKIPQDVIRRTVGKVLDGLYSSGERDRYRTRVERNSSGGVDIFITHRGMVEDFRDTQKTSTVWKSRPSDPELEIEFMRRLMVKLGSPANKDAAALPAQAQAAPELKVQNLNGRPSLVLQDSLDRVWRRTGVALDRSGFTVEDRDRNKGLYYVRYVPPSVNEEPGFLSRLFSNSAQAPQLTRYQIQVQSANAAGEVLVQVLNHQGQVENSAGAEKILKLLAAEMR